MQEREMATFVLEFAGGTFPGIPAGGIVGAEAVLIEPAGTPGEVAGAISDRVELSIGPSAVVGGRQEIMAVFDSDDETRAPQFPPAGFKFGVQEEDRLLDITGNFFTGGQTNPTAVTLPQNLIVKVHSDVVPEPTTVLLVGTMVAGLGLAAWRRRRQS